MDQKEVEQGLQEWLKNPYWAEYYNKAPSERCKAYIAMDFRYSDTEDEEVAAELDRIGDSLSLEDWNYIYQHTAGPGKAAIAKRIAEMKK